MVWLYTALTVATVTIQSQTSQEKCPIVFLRSLCWGRFHSTVRRFIILYYMKFLQHFCTSFWRLIYISNTSKCIEYTCNILYIDYAMQNVPHFFQIEEEGWTMYLLYGWALFAMFNGWENTYIRSNVYACVWHFCFLLVYVFACKFPVPGGTHCMLVGGMGPGIADPQVIELLDF